MGGKSAKQEVTEYRMSIHYGVCHGPVDVIRKIWVGEKVAWKGILTGNASLSIDNDELFGGIKKEGGVRGRCAALFGGSTQVLSDFLASKMGLTSDTCPGYRGLTSLFFTEEEGDEYPGFYWIANVPYLKSLWVTVGRGSVGLQPEYAKLYRGSREKRSLHFAIDHSGSMDFEAAPGITRKDTMRAAMGTIFDRLRQEIQAGVEIDVGISAWGTSVQSSGYTDASVADIDALESWLNSRGNLGGTDFNDAANAIHNWWVDSLADSTIKKRVSIFITDGEPNTGSTGASGAAILADELSSTGGSFNTTDGTAVEIYGINIILTNIDETVQMDNTPGDSVPVVSGSDPSGLATAVENALYGDDVDFDSNPAHIIYESMRNKLWGMGCPASLIDKPSFEDAAVTLFGEGFGLSMMWVNQAKCEVFIREVVDHIEAALFISPKTGKWKLKLIRDDYDEADLRTLTPDNCRVTKFGRKPLGELINEVVVTYTSPENEEERSVVAQDRGGIEAQGAVVSDTRNYYGVRTSSLAMKLAQRDVRSASYPLASGEIEADRTFWDVEPGDVLKLYSPEDDIAMMVIRVGKVDYGKPGDRKVRFAFVEDIFGKPAQEYDEPGDGSWEDPSPEPEPMEFTQLFTAPYVLVISQMPPGQLNKVEWPDTTAAVFAAQSTLGTFEFDLYSLNGSAYELEGTRQTVQRSLLGTALTPQATSLIASLTSPTPGPSPNVGRWLLIGSGTDDAMELAEVTAYTAGVGWTVKRGILDTVPRSWPIGTPVWCLTDQSVIDNSIRSEGETVTYKLRSRTAMGVLPLAQAPAVSRLLTDRPWLPFRPANVKVNGVSGLTTGFIDSRDVPVELTFSTRNRITEDTTFLAWTEADVTEEDGQTTVVEMYNHDSNVLLATYTAVTSPFTVPDADYASANRIRLKVMSERDGLRSLTGLEVKVVVNGYGYGFGYGLSYGT